MTVSGSRAFVYSLFQDIVLLGSIILAVWIRYRIEPFVFGESGEPLSVFVVFLIFKASFHYFNLYQVNLHLSLREFVSRLLAVNIVSLVLLTILYYSYPPLIIGRGILAFCVVSVIFSTSLYRGLWSALSRDVAFSKNVLILGDERAARVVVEEIEDYRHSGYRVVGLISGKAERVGEDIARGRKIIGTNADMRRICDEEDIDLIIVALEESRGNLPVNELMDLKVLGVQIVESTDFHEQFRGKIVLEGLRASWFIFSDGFVVGRFQHVTKRIFDVAAALTLLVVTAPIAAAVTFLVKVTSRGPVLYKQERVGRHGHTFTLFKFRSMTVDSEKDGPQWAVENDPRVTGIGRFIRRFRIDEIPQILNVLRGEMSFVGPRPERPFFVTKLTRMIPFYSQRHVIKPGITGWAQVRYPYGSTIEDAKEKLQLDLYYIKNVSLAFDLKILVETISVVFGKMKAH